MTEKENNILSKIDRKSGFKTPDNYFDDFAKHMEGILPTQEPIHAAGQKVVRHSFGSWKRIRPYAYAAALVTGVLGLMFVFNSLSNTSNGNLNREMVAGFDKSDATSDSLMIEDGVSGEDIVSYEDSVSAQELATEEAK